MPNLLWSIRSRMVTAIVIAVAAAAGLGYLADRYFGTYPKLLVAAILISFPITNIITVKVGRAHARRELEKEKAKE